ncbi:MAG: hypothetical protein WC341_01565 [Bacteroidales bacterium]|jgi:hypothetical protein
MGKMIKIIKNNAIEILIIFLYILLINNYLGNTDKTLNADGEGYYEYLPSLFIHHDIFRKNSTAEQDPTLYERISKYGFYVNYQNFKVNKYPCGTAVLEAPFFFYTYLTTPLAGDENDGYQLPFQRTVFHAAIFYLFLSLLFLARILKLYDVRKSIIVIIQLLVVFSTGVLHYANYEAGFSHIYSMFAITAFVYFSKTYFINRQRKDFLFASLFLGLILILRQVNVVIILFIPFLAGSFAELKAGLSIFKDLRTVLFSLLIILGLFSIQSFFWYAQTGHFLVYSYQGEGFNFLEPEIVNVLFSYRKGLFIYTPILIISLFGLLYLVYKRQYYLVVTWLLFFSILTYLLSSWHSWFYGCSYGQRPYIDYYIIFFILLAIFMDRINHIFRVLIILISLATIPINIIQTYQYKSFIMHWILMDEIKYWDIFLKTSDKYRGLVWKKTYNLDYLTETAGYDLGDMKIEKDTDKVIFKINSDTLEDLDNVKIIRLQMDNHFYEQNNSRIILSIKDILNNKSYYWHSTPFIVFKEGKFGEWQTGLYNYEFNPIPDSISKNLQIQIEAVGGENDLKNVRVSFLRKK